MKNFLLILSIAFILFCSAAFASIMTASIMTASITSPAAGTYYKTSGNIVFTWADNNVVALTLA
ncbi:MAG: hypothetical protein COT15_01305, partial [Candidatus Diapherotrites archaeon CG08_land_8_20_14_0_20_34_12]